MTNITFDTSGIVKGINSPRRKKKDKIYEEQMRLHQLSKSILNKIVDAKYKLFIPSVCLIEIGSVISRLTNDYELSQSAVNFIRNHSTILFDNHLLEKSIEVGIKSKASGFDSIFIACADITNSILITDDKRMFEIALEMGLESYLLRETKNSDL